VRPSAFNGLLGGLPFMKEEALKREERGLVDDLS